MMAGEDDGMEPGRGLRAMGASCRRMALVGVQAALVGVQAELHAASGPPGRGLAAGCAPRTRACGEGPRDVALRCNKGRMAQRCMHLTRVTNDDLVRQGRRLRIWRRLWEDQF